MAKAWDPDQLKLPKRLLGVKVPRKARKQVNRTLKSLSSELAKPLVSAAIGALVTMLAERLEQPRKAAGEGDSAKNAGPGGAMH